MTVEDPDGRLSELSRTHLALLLLHEHLLWHRSKIRHEKMWFAAGFIFAVLTAATDRTWWLLVCFVLLMVISVRDWIKKTDEAELCSLGMQEEILLIAYEEYGRGFSINWKEGTVVPPTAPQN